MVCAQAPQGARHSFTWRFRPQVYHSTMNERPDVQVVCGCSILPIKTTCRGPAPPCSEGAGHCPRNPCCASFAHARTLAAPPPPYPHSAPPLCVGEDDIIDEVLGFFKANVLFKQFEVKGPADRVLIYMTLYTTQCLSKLTTCATKAEGVRALTSMAHETFRIPGEAGFPLGSFFPSPENSQEAGARARCARDGGGGRAGGWEVYAQSERSGRARPRAVRRSRGSPPPHRQSGPRRMGGKVQRDCSARRARRGTRGLR